MTVLKPIREVYREEIKEDDGWGWGVSDYQPMIESIAPIELQMDDQDYQGSSYILFREGDRWGYLTFGWGSCSGCDSLQGCDSWELVAELRMELVASTHWETDAMAMLRWMVNRPWDFQWEWSSSRLREFLPKAISLLAVYAFMKSEPD